MLRPNPRLILAGSGRVRRPCPNHRESSAKSPSPLANGGYRGVPMARQHGTRQPAPGRRDRTIRSPASYWAVEKSVLHKLRFPPDFVVPSSLRCEGGSPFFPPLRRGGRRGGPGTTSHRRFPRSLPLSPFASLSRGEKNRSRPSGLPHHPPLPPLRKGGKGAKKRGRESFYCGIKRINPPFPFASSPATAAFPIVLQGRRPHWTFRGLLDVHSGYGLSARRVAMRPVCLEGSDGFVTSTAAPIATGWSDPVAGWELHPLKINTLPRRTRLPSPFPPRGRGMKPCG